MKKATYTVNISAPAAKVYDVMLGISDKSTYEQWTALFNPTSSYYGSWDRGSKMLFVGVDEMGEKGGLVSEIAENIPNQFVSIRHVGLVKGDEEIYDGPEVEKWANGHENYTFEDDGGGTTVTVDVDVTDEFLEYMDQTYPAALNKLREMCEG